MSEEWLGIKEAASYAGVHRHTIYRWVKSGILKAYRLPSGTMRFKREDLIALRDARS